VRKYTIEELNSEIFKETGENIFHHLPNNRRHEVIPKSPRKLAISQNHQIPENPTVSPKKKKNIRFARDTLKKDVLVRGIEKTWSGLDALLRIQKENNQNYIQV
jgi:hypothetical protein